MTRDTLQTFGITYGLGMPIAIMLWTALPTVVIHAAAFIVLSFGLGAIAFFATNLMHAFGTGIMIVWRFARDIKKLNAAR